MIVIFPLKFLYLFVFFPVLVPVIFNTPFLWNEKCIRYVRLSYENRNGTQRQCHVVWISTVKSYRMFHFFHLNLTFFTGPWKLKTVHQAIWVPWVPQNWFEFWILSRQREEACVCWFQLGQIEALNYKFRPIWSGPKVDSNVQELRVLSRWRLTMYTKRLLLFFLAGKIWSRRVEEESSISLQRQIRHLLQAATAAGDESSKSPRSRWRAWGSWPGASPSSSARSWRSQWERQRGRWAGRAWWRRAGRRARRRTVPRPPSCQSSGASTAWASKSVRRNKQMVKSQQLNWFW